MNLGKVTLDKCVFHYKSPKLTTTLFLDDVTLQNLSTKPGDQSAKIELKARLNKSGINATIHLDQLMPEVKAGGDISVQKIDLNEFAGLTTDLLDKLAGLIDLSGKFSVSASQGSDIDASYTGNTIISSTIVSSKDFAVASTELKWDGNLSFKTQSDSSQQTIKLDGELAGSELAVSLPDALDAKGSKLYWQGAMGFNSQSTGAMVLNLDGKMDANGYAAQLPGIDASGSEANWQGKVDYTKTGTSAPQEIQVAGKLNAKQLSLALAEQNLSIQQQAISLNPVLSLQISDEKTGLSGTTNVQASGTLIKDTAKALTLLAINKLDVNGVKAESLDQVKINGITIKETGLIQKQDSKQPTFAIDETTITDFNYDGNQGLAIQGVALGKLTGSFVREEDGSIDVSNVMHTPDSTGKETDETTKQPAKEPQAETEKETAGKEFGINIREITVKDSSTIRFTDKTVSPTFKSELNIASLKITDIDSNKPDQPIAINLDGKLNNYASLVIKGSVKPFKEQPGIDLKIDLDNQNMVNLSPYVIASTGYLVRSGQLDVNSKIVINDGNIDAKNTFFVKKLKLEEADTTVVKENAGSIGMPLDKALGMLRDKNDNIKLEVPITGKLDEVEIGTGQIINTALKKATTAGMKTYLLYAFQPYGAMIIAGQAVGKRAGKITLDPVIYEAGESDLTSKQKDYLNKLGKVMQDRPKIDVQICAFSTAADLSIRKESAEEKYTGELSQSQINKSLELGQVRQKAIKDFLISKFKINDGRLILCAPEYDKSKDAKPRVELLI